MAEYTPTGNYNDAALSADDQKKMASLKKQWETYTAAGDTGSANAVHQEAENLRANYGYSGGTDGSEYHAVEVDKEIPKVTQGPTSQEDYVNQLYDAQQKSALAELEKAYNQNMLTYDNATAEIPKAYQAARNQTAATNQVERANFNEYAAASGLNTGATGQIQLARSNQNQANLSSLQQAEADALAQIEQQRTATKVAYQDSIAAAIASGDLARAQALYEEAVRVDEGMVNKALNDAQLAYNYDYLNFNKDATQYNQQTDAQNTSYNQMLNMAQTLAAYGDFSGYKALGYTDEQIANMQAYWQLQNGINPSGGSGGGGGGTGNTTPTEQVPAAKGLSAAYQIINGEGSDYEKALRIANAGLQDSAALYERLKDATSLDYINYIMGR